MRAKPRLPGAQLTTLIAGIVLLLLASGAWAKKTSSAAGDSAKITAAQKAAAVVHIWEARDLQGQDLHFAGAPEKDAPQGPFTFVSEDLNATAPKLLVRDANGRKFRVKLGKSNSNSEVHSEPAADRIFWACGYHAESAYYVKNGVVTGITPEIRKGFKRIGKLLTADPQNPSQAHFEEASFRRKGGRGILSDSETWSLSNPPKQFADTPQFSGMKLLNVLLNNWDVTDLNNKVVYVQLKSGEIEAWYEISDLGASFGKLPTPSGIDKLTRTLHYDKWDLHRFQSTEKYIKGVHDGSVEFTFKNNPFGRAQDGAVHRKIPVEHVKWFLGVIGNITPEQFHQIFDAAGATPDEATGFTDVLLNKIDQLRKAVAP